MTAIDEEVRVSDADLDDVPVCGGLMFGPVDALRTEECPNPAVWRMTATCCKTRTIFKCDSHRATHEFYGLGCRYCGSFPIELTWRKL